MIYRGGDHKFPYIELVTGKRIVSYRLPHFAPAFPEMGGFRTFKNPSVSFMTWESQTASGPMGFVPVPEMQFMDSKHYKEKLRSK